LRAAGVATKLSRYPGMIHGFFTLSPYLDAGKRASAEVVATLRASI
jgi:acetyl esterase